MTDAEVANLLGDHFILTPYGPQGFIDKLRSLGLRIIEDQPDHIVEFRDNGWQVQHSVDCRIEGKLLDCEYHKAVANDMAEPEKLGRIMPDFIVKPGRFRLYIDEDSGGYVYERIES